MSEKLFEEDRYIIKNFRVYDTYKKLPITPKLTIHECEVIIAHLNYHKEIITTKGKQLRYVHNEYDKIKKENEQLKSENENLKSNIDDLLNQELDDRDIVCQAGKFRLEEWGKHRYHQFYNGDESLEDESVVIMLMEQSKENEQLKQLLDYADDLILSYMSVHNRDEWENIKKNIKGDV